MEDLGSGTLLDLRPFGLYDEPTVPEVVASGVDIVTFSGDKLLGGPQAGILVGKAPYIAAARRHPLHRAMRVDKFTVAALEATLRLYADPELARRNIPTLTMLSMSPQTLAQRVRRLRRRLPPAVQAAYQPRVIDGNSAVGGGAFHWRHCRRNCWRCGRRSVRSLHSNAGCAAAIRRSLDALPRTTISWICGRCSTARSLKSLRLSNNWYHRHETDCLRHRRSH